MVLAILLHGFKNGTSYLIVNYMVLAILKHNEFEVDTLKHHIG